MRAHTLNDRERSMNRESELFTLLRSIVKKTRGILEREIAPLGMGHAEMRLLMMLYHMDGCSQEELASGIEVDRTNVGRSLKKMEGLEYVRRERDPADSRAYRIYLTSRGWGLRRRLEHIRSCLERTIAGGVKEEELLLVLDLLGRMDRQVDHGRYLAVKEAYPFVAEEGLPKEEKRPEGTKKA